MAPFSACIMTLCSPRPTSARSGAGISGQWLTRTSGPSTESRRYPVAATRSRHHRATDGYGSACSRPSSTGISPAARAVSNAADLGSAGRSAAPPARPAATAVNE